jgi:hypothetical protein
MLLDDEIDGASSSIFTVSQRNNNENLRGDDFYTFNEKKLKMAMKKIDEVFE